VKRYIRAKRKLIALLNEQKQAIIRRAVTRGLEPNVPLKPSGVAWLGDVPEHWEVSRIRACLKDTKAGIWGDDPTPDNIADQVICLRVADFDMSRFGVSPARLTMRAVPESARTPRLLVPGDILMEKSGGGEAEPVGRVVLFRGESAPHAISSNFIVRLRPDPSIVKPEFLLNVLAMMQATRRNVAWIKQTTGIQNLDERAYLSLSIGIPPLEEQEQIVRHIDHTTGSTNNALSRIVMEIDLIHEYRTRIIADAVTGKLDVREAAAALPDDADAVESEAEELLDDDAANDDVELDTEPEEAEV
jgi:type I restriction enzyme S subunit